MNPIKWKRNEFLTFYAAMKMNVGSANATITIEQGESFEYDGTMLKYAGHEVAQPSLRGAIGTGWATLSEDDAAEGVSARTVNRNIAKAQTRNNNLSRVERTSGSSIQVDTVDEGQVAEVSARRGTELRDQPKRILTRQDIGGDEGITVARLRTSSKLGPVDVTRNTSLAKQLEERDFQKPEYLIVTKDDERPRRVHADAENQTVGQVRKSVVKDADGVTLNHPKKGVAEVKAKEAEERTFEIKKPAKKVKLSTNPKIRMAQRIYPDFPTTWDFTGKLAERLARVKAYSEDPEFLEALYAAENDQGRRALAIEYEDLFGE